MGGTVPAWKPGNNSVKKIGEKEADQFHSVDQKEMPNRMGGNPPEWKQLGKKKLGKNSASSSGRLKTR